MPLSVEEVEDKDLSTVLNLTFAAFYESNPMEPLVFLLGFTASVCNSSLAREKSAFLEPDTHYLKVIDSNLANQTGQPLPADHGHDEGEDGVVQPTVRDNSIIAYANFKMWREDREATDWDTPYNIREGDLGSAGDVNLQIARSFFGQQREMSRKFIGGRKSIFLNWLATHPSHERQGAGTLLLERVCEIASREGLDVYLQSTPVAYPLYLRFRFEDVASFDVDLGTLANGVASGKRLRTVLMKLKFTAPDPGPS